MNQRIGQVLQRWLPRRQMGGFVTVGIVLTLVGAMAITFFGAGAVSRALSLWDGEVWLWNGKDGEIARVNGDAKSVNTRSLIKDSRGHDVQIVQNDSHLLLRDKTTGTVTSLDLADLSISGAVATAGKDEIKIALYNDIVVLADPAKGIVRQLDPKTLKTVGEVLNLPPGLTGGDFDESGALWFGVPSQGTALAIKASPGNEGLQIDRTIVVSEPGHKASLTVLDEGAAVMDATEDKLTTLAQNGDKKTTTVQAGSQATMPERTRGDVIAITNPVQRKVFLVQGENVTSLKVPSASSKLEPAVIYQERVYLFDSGNDRVLVLDQKGKKLQQISIEEGTVTFETREGHLIINANGTNTAWVVDENQSIKKIEKNPGKVPQAEPSKSANSSGALSGRGPSSSPSSTPNQPPASSALPSPQLPSVSAPSVPTQAPPVSQPSVPQPPTSPQLPPNQPPASTNVPIPIPPSTPSSPPSSSPTPPRADKPNAPVGVRATAGDASATIVWAAAADNGSPIQRYIISGHGKEQTVNGNTLMLTITGLTNGQTYQFLVRAENAEGQGPDAQANPVTPQPSTPDAPTNVNAALANDGSVDVSWTPGNTYGGTLARYEITAVPSGGGTARTINAGTNTQMNVPVGTIQAGVSYTFSVKAIMVDNTSSKDSEKSQPVTPYSKPGQPSAIGATAGGPGEATVTWGEAPANGKAITGYVIKASSGAVYNAGPGERSYKFTGLPKGQDVSFTAHATNSAGPGPEIGSAPVRVPDDPPPPPPTGRVTCNNSSQTGDPTYCNNGINVHAQPNKAAATTASLPSGSSVTPTCKIQGEEVTAWLYNSNKTSNWWLRRSQGDYIPYAWVNFPGADGDLNRVPNC